MPASMRCPDPSAHKTKDTSLQDHASAAAFYSTSPTRGPNQSQASPLDLNGKLSSASAATSLKQARAHDLLSFPMVGADTQSSASTAANLANANKKNPEWWKPEQSAAAGRAALLAKDYKMAPLWRPEASAAGSKAALLAHRGGANPKLWTPEASTHGNSAAAMAMKKPSQVPAVDYRHIEDGKKKALLAATGAVSSSGRKRAQSTPTLPSPYPDSENSAKNALSAATIAHTPSMKARNSPAKPAVPVSNNLGSGAMEAARIQHSKSISRDMYTEHPPVALEIEEKKRKDALRASAISMARKMIDIQQNHLVQAGHAQTGATAAHGQQKDTDLKEQAMRYINVQEAAQKLAAERLAKIGPDENAAFRSYYGYDKPTRAKLSLRRGRNRAFSNPETVGSDDDELRSRQVRSQMSLLNKQLAEVDAKKREQDRKYLLAAAERKVQAQMQGLDKKIFDETGKMSPAMLEEWDAKARAKAAVASEARMENHGKVHIGHGKFMDQADIDAVAQARIQPTLDEINEKTKKRRAEEEERRLELDMKKREEQKEKERAAELKAEERRIKDCERKAAKTRNAEGKATVKLEKQAEKEKKAEEKRMTKEEKRKSGEAAKDTAAAPVDATPPTTDASPTADASATAATENSNDGLYRDPTPAAEAAHPPEPELSSPTSPASATSPKSDSKGIKSFLNKFKRRSKHSATSAEAEKPGFIGGIALRRSKSQSNRNSVPSGPHPEPTHMPHAKPQRRYSDVSSISTKPVSANNRGRTTQRTGSHTSTVSRGSTEFGEARDEFDEKLAPPPSFTALENARRNSPNRDSRFHEIGI